MDLNQEMSRLSRICMPMCKRVINTDISEDMTLPDYYPEIRRVLYVRENLLPPAKFISGSKVDISGIVDYSLVYVSGDGKLSTAPLSAEYAFSLPLENVAEFEMSEGVTVMAHSVAESSTIRLNGPRRLQLRSRIRSDVSAWGKMSCAETVEGLNDPASIERLTGECVCADILCESTDVISIEAEQSLPSANCRVALVDSTVMIRSSDIDGEMIRISGDVVLRMLVTCDGDNYGEQVVNRLPFDAETDLDGVDADEESLLRVTGNTSDISINVEDGTATIRVDVVLEICVGQNKTVRYTSDAYSVEQRSEPVMKLCYLPVLLRNNNFNFSQSERIALSELNFPEGAEIVDTCGNAIAEEVRFEDGRYIMRGSCRYNIICRNGGEYISCDVRVPFKYETDGDIDVDYSDIIIVLNGCRAKSDGEFLSLDCELLVACTLFGSNQVEMLERIGFSEALERQGGEWIVCYVGGDDSTWSIAKRYGVRAADIKGDPTNDRFVMIER